MLQRNSRGPVFRRYQQQPDSRRAESKPHERGQPLQRAQGRRGREFSLLHARRRHTLPRDRRGQGIRRRQALRQRWRGAHSLGADSGVQRIASCPSQVRPRPAGRNEGALCRQAEDLVALGRFQDGQHLPGHSRTLAESHQGSATARDQAASFGLRLLARLGRSPRLLPVGPDDRREHDDRRSNAGASLPGHLRHRSVGRSGRFGARRRRFSGLGRRHHGHPRRQPDCSLCGRA
ncbi:hypothetical protein D9M72_527900 [compost metagenome]